MSTILVTGDFHIKQSELEELNTQLTFINQFIKENDVTHLCILGDIFDHPKPNAVEIHSFIQFIRQIPINIPIYIIAGNHDLMDKNHSSIDWIELIRENIIYNLSSLDIEVDDKKIKMIHCNVEESLVGPDDINIPGGSINQYKDYDVVLLGHIHKSQIIKETKPLALHPGSITYNNFGERNDEKGFYVLHTSKESLKYSFIKLNPVPMYQFIIDESLNDVKPVCNLPENSKVKIVFKGNINSLEYLEKIENIIKICTNKFKVFKYEIQNTVTYSVTPTIEKEKSLKDLLEEFYKKEKVDKKIQEMMNKYIL